MKKILLTGLVLFSMTASAFAHDRHYREHHHHRGYRGAEIGIGIGAAAAIIGLGIAAEASRHRSRRENCYYDHVYYRDRFGGLYTDRVLVCN